MADDHPVLPGSARRPLAAARPSGTLDTEAALEVTLVLRRRTELPAGPARQLSPAEFAATYGADPADVAAVQESLTAEGLEVTAVDPASRRGAGRGPGRAPARGVRPRPPPGAPPAPGPGRGGAPPPRRRGLG